MSQKSEKVESKNAKTSAGSFKVKQATRKPIEQEVEEGLAGEELEEIGKGEAVSETEQMVGEMLVEASAKMIGKTAELLTKIPEMNFDEDEIEQLKAVWTPLMPAFSPVFGAIIVTLTIVAGKAVIYRSGRKRIKVEEEGEKFEEMGPKSTEK